MKTANCTALDQNGSDGLHSGKKRKLGSLAGCHDFKLMHYHFPGRISGMRKLLKRWWFWIGAVGVVAVLVAGVLIADMKDSTEAKFGKVKAGMTKKEVDALLEETKIKSAPLPLDVRGSLYVYETNP